MTPEETAELRRTIRDLRKKIMKTYTDLKHMALWLQIEDEILLICSKLLSMFMYDEDRTFVQLTNDEKTCFCGMSLMYAFTKAYMRPGFELTNKLKNQIKAMNTNEAFKWLKKHAFTKENNLWSYK